MAGNKDAFYTQVRQLGILTTIPIILLVGPVIGFVIGGWIDRKFHIYPWVTIIFVTLGFVASGREIVQILKQVSKENDSEKKS